MADRCLDGDRPVSGGLLLGLIIAAVAYAAGKRNAVARQAWADYRDVLAKLTLLGKLRWAHLFAAVWVTAAMWALIAIAARAGT